ncbi:MAG: S-methyl-5-thioribose-1-phosphate isomerase [Armatimonadetes bacterium]|nr:S-methyl-5-thioribose-1-phosphate isomerase [Armatimonadota bacterium]MDE2205888.1 S-methyl-5-thioribose-1-phosphate isomerase [Armatimonadota bacterium]
MGSQGLPPTVAWRNGAAWLIDQRILPGELKVIPIHSAAEMADAISSMVVRGAPAIGCCAALGLLMTAASHASCGRPEFDAAIDADAALLKRSRPTAVNLGWAVDKLLATAADVNGGPLAAFAAMEACAIQMLEEDVAANCSMGRHGAALLPQSGGVLTHCNAGALATVGYGTALGVIRAAVEQGKSIRVFADETRPRLQGMRLTAWELAQDGIPVTVLADGAAASLMRSGCVDCVVVGADRIAANGDTANKVGTYSVAISAARHALPFYVAAPLSTFDLALRDGLEIPIEQRDSSEVSHVEGVQLAPNGVDVWNPAFDVTPAELITAFITELGVLRPPYHASIAGAFRAAGRRQP